MIIVPKTLGVLSAFTLFNSVFFLGIYWRLCIYVWTVSYVAMLLLLLTTIYFKQLKELQFCEDIFHSELYNETNILVISYEALLYNTIVEKNSFLRYKILKDIVNFIHIKGSIPVDESRLECAKEFLLPVRKDFDITISLLIEMKQYFINKTSLFCEVYENVLISLKVIPVNMFKKLIFIQFYQLMCM